MKSASLLPLLILIVVIVSMWVIFTKAKKPGWASIIPIYNLIILLEIVKKPWWWVILFLIPLVNIVILIIVYHKLSESFGQGVGFTIGLILLPFIFMPLLAFGNYQYKS
jgi:membrane protease YdiL (CAAX protease family)